MNDQGAWVLVEQTEGDTIITASDDRIVAVFSWNWDAWYYGGPLSRRYMIEHYRQMPKAMRAKLRQTMHEVA